jgi:hypothetical protein
VVVAYAYHVRVGAFCQSGGFESKLSAHHNAFYVYYFLADQQWVNGAPGSVATT